MLKFVIVGHVDHGKSTLIGRLLYDTDSLPLDKIEEIKKTSKDLGREMEFAYLLDHLEEERQQGITIDTTQVFFKSNRRQYVIIDAPGHVEFVKNMITGASHAEAAVLIIDSKEGVKQQTKRHAYILSLLGINQVIVVINKMDLSEYNRATFNALKKDAEKFLENIGMKASFYIPISALRGENIIKKSEKMTWYQGVMFIEALNLLKKEKSPENQGLIFPIQDVYKVGNKKIAAGRLEAGAIKKGQSIKILPHSQITRIKTIEKYPSVVKEAFAGENIGITTEDEIFLDRGDIVCEEHRTPFLTESFSANIFWLSKTDFCENERLIIRCGTQETTCKIEVIKKRIDSSTFEIIEENSDRLKNLEVGEVLVKVKKPMLIKTFNDVQRLGRFVFIKEGDTCAGGIVSFLR